MLDISYKLCMISHVGQSDKEILQKQVLLDAVIQFEKYKQLNSFAVTLLRINMGFPQSSPDTRAWTLRRRTSRCFWASPFE